MHLPYLLRSGLNLKKGVDTAIINGANLWRSNPFFNEDFKIK